MSVKRPIEVVGDVAYIPLTQGKTAIIDAKDVPLVEGRNWCVQRWSGSLCYAVSNIQGSRRTLLYMHRVILEPPGGMDTDHINHDGLDNRRHNLRTCTPSQNQANARRTVIGKSRFRGVCWDKRGFKWTAKISEKHVHLGRFDSEIEAARAYDAAALKRYGEFASPNFP